MGSLGSWLPKMALPHPAAENCEKITLFVHTVEILHVTLHSPQNSESVLFVIFKYFVHHKHIDRFRPKHILALEGGLLRIFKMTGRINPLVCLKDLKSPNLETVGFHWTALIPQHMKPKASVLSDGLQLEVDTISTYVFVIWLN